jgi:formylglycine-generating enzyme required for sulfatase activity
MMNRRLSPRSRPRLRNGATADDEKETPATEGQNEDPEPSAETPRTETFYYTFIVFPAGEYVIGSVEDEPDRDKNRRNASPVTLTRSFALLDREITMKELIAFQPVYESYMQQFDAEPKDAGFAGNWYESVLFCRWLGDQYGLTEAEQPYASPEALTPAEYQRETAEGATWAPKNWPLELGRRGFRLPTESEWEVRRAPVHGRRTVMGAT